VADFIELEKQLFAHDLQSANLLSVFLLRQEHLSISTLPNLGENLKVSMMEPGAAFSEIGSFTTKIFVQS
jgi:hypothetical protein